MTIKTIDLSALKKNDVLYAINSGYNPIIITLFVDSVVCDEKVFSNTYNIKVLMPDGTYKFIEFHKPSKTDHMIENKAYIKTLNDSIISEYDDKNSYIVGFDRNIVVKHYTDNIKKHIQCIETTIERGKNNLIELNEKLRYIEKQIDLT